MRSPRAWLGAGVGLGLGLGLGLASGLGLEISSCFGGMDALVLGSAAATAGRKLPSQKWLNGPWPRSCTSPATVTQSTSWSEIWSSGCSSTLGVITR